ncbi:MAG: hypothetical protein IT204_16765 [Fimbriimonadaceae bacterium]|nr:hypothetical protein [Fimbriimonadaceae bacterium]
MSRWTRALLVVSALLAAPSWAAVPIMSLDDVKPGMKGYGRTVFQGTQIEQFDVTVIGVLEAFEFEMDMILIRVDSGPVVTRNYGIVAGMSGSPIYIDGKMIGALAYGWEFQQEPIAGVTPIEQMLAQYDPTHPDAVAAKARRAARETRRAQPAGLALPDGLLKPVGGTVEVAGRNYEQVLVTGNTRNAETLRRTHPTAGLLTPVATPLLVSGVGAAGMRMLERLLEPYNLRPLQTGGSGAPADTPVDFSPGAAIAVPIALGDIEMTGVGTMTYRDGDMVLGFGHPMFGLGRVDLPMATAYITTVINSAASSNKMGGAIATIGKISQDRPTCIGGTIGGKADLMPIRFTLTEQDRGVQREFDLELFRQPQMSEMFAVSLMQAAMQNVAGGFFDGVTNTHLEVDLRPLSASAAPQRIVRNNSFDSKATSSFGVNPLWDVFMTLTLLRQNPFGEAKVNRMRVDMTFEGSRRFANIERAQAGQQAVRPGETFDVLAHLKPYGGASRPLSIPVKVPDNAPLGPMLVVLIGGNDAFALRPRVNPTPEPTDVPGLIKYLNNTVRNDSVLVEVILPTTGVMMSGWQVQDLPEPMVEPLVASLPEGGETTNDVIETVVPLDEVLTGAAAVMVEVVGEEGKKSEDKPDIGSIRGGMGGGGGMEMPNQMTMAAENAARELTAGLPSGPEFSWAVRPPRPASVQPQVVDGWLQQYQHRLHSLRESYLVRRAAARAAAPKVPARPVTTARVRPAPVADLPAADSPPPAETPAGADPPPDITDSLDLKKPPKMPAYGELDELEKGNLNAAETPDEEPGPDEEPAADEEDEDGDPIARPVGVWTLNSAEDFQGGRFEGTFPLSDGQVGLAPAIKTLGKPEAERVWTVLPWGGATLVGCWAPEAKVYRIAAGGKPEVWLQTDDYGLVALAPYGKDSFVAGGIPSGKIYQVTGKGQSKVLADLDESYIWKLVADGQGGLYAATGNRGRLYHIDAKGHAKVVLQAERHLLAMCAAPKGGVYVGSWPQGKVYLVSGDKVETVFQAKDSGVLGLTATANGNVYVGTDSSGEILKIDPTGEVTTVAELEDGLIYALTSVKNTVYAATAGPGQLLRIDDEDVTAQLYGTDEPFMLDVAARSEDVLVASIAGSGEVVELNLKNNKRGYFYSPIHDAEMRARWGVLQYRALTTPQQRVVMETRSGNTSYPDRGWSPWAAVSGAAGGLQIASPAARYLQFRATLVNEGPADGCRLDRVDVFYRTFNRPPTVTIVAPEPGAVANKEVEISWEAEDPDEDELHFDVYYAKAGSAEWTKIEAPVDEEEPDDSEPTDDEPASDDPPASDDAAALNRTGAKTMAGINAPVALPNRTGARAAANQPRGLRLVADEASAAKAEASGDKPPKDKEEPKKSDDSEEKLSEDSLTWDTSELADGFYQVKVVAHDDLRNPEDPKSAERVSKPFLVDNTGPYLAAQRAGEGRPPKQIKLGEDGTYLSSAEWRLDDGEWKAIQPVDGIFDSRFETVACPDLPAEPGEYTLTLRVRDAVGNVAKFQWVWTVEEK